MAARLREGWKCLRERALQSLAYLKVMEVSWKRKQKNSTINHLQFRHQCFHSSEEITGGAMRYRLLIEKYFDTSKICVKLL